MTVEMLNTGAMLMALVMSIMLAVMAFIGRLPRRTGELHRIKDLEVMVRVLQNDHMRDAQKIDQLGQELAEAKERIHFLESQLAQYRTEKQEEERMLLAVVGSDPALKVDLAALREVESECALVVTRCFPARFNRFEATLNRYRAAGTPIKLVHFSVHSQADDAATGTKAAALFEDGQVSGERLSGVLNGVEVIMVAGCDSDLLGDLLGVASSVVTFREPVRHESAALAAKLFWTGIGKGLGARQAFREARAKMPAEVAEFMELHQ